MISINLIYLNVIIQHPTPDRQFATLTLAKELLRNFVEYAALLLPLVHHMPNSSEDVSRQAHQMPLAMSLAILKFYPSLACLTEKCPHIFQVRLDGISRRGKQKRKLPQNSD